MHNGLINQTGVAYNECGSWDSEEMIPQDHPGPGIPLRLGRGSDGEVGSLRMLCCTYIILPKCI